MLSSNLLLKIVVVHPYGCWVTGVGLSSKILPKIVAAHPHGSWVTATAQLGGANSRMSRWGL